MAQSGFTPIKLYLSTTAAAVPLAADLAPGELAINNNDGKLFYEDSSGVVQVIATKAGASGDVVGPASATANAVPSFNGTTGKLIQNNSGVTISAGVMTATGFAGPLNGVVGATTPAAVTATQVDITAQGDLRLQDTTGGEYVALQAPAALAASYTLTLPVDDGTAGQVLATDGSGVLSWSTAAVGDVVGPASATDNAVARFDATTGKIIQNSVVTIADTTGNMAGVGTLSSGAITSSSLTSGRVPYAGTAGLIQDAAALTFDGTILSATRFAGALNGTVGATTPAVGTFTTLSNTGTAYLGGLLGAESLRVAPVVSAVNYWEASGAASNYAPILSAQGSDSDISIEVNPKGTGRLYVSSDLEISSGIRVGKGAGDLPRNTVCGYNAFASNTTGDFNTAIGREALYSNDDGFYNTAIGSEALLSAVSGFNNVAVGYESLLNTTSGSNVCIGSRAGRSITSGSNNVCLGTSSGYDGLVTLTTASDTVVLGNNSTTTLYCKTSTITTSDLRDKTNVRPVTLGLDFVNQINPIAYQFKVSREDATPSSRTYLGWAAQDVLANQGAENIVDQHDPENLKMAGMDMVAVLWKSVQELSAKVAELEAKLSAK
jgi:hypothetical protein